MKKAMLGCVIAGLFLGGTWAAAAGAADRSAPGAKNCRPYIRTELFFGARQPDGRDVSPERFTRFLDEQVTPRFPEGLTVMSGTGRYRDADGRVQQEGTELLVLLYPKGEMNESGERIEEIRSAYIQQFQQESVLRVDDPRPVCTSF